MTRRIPFLFGVLAILAGGAACSSGDQVAVDLIDALPNAKQVRPRPESFTVAEATIAGDARRAILGHEPGRIVWQVDVPEGAWLKVGLGMLEPSWTVDGDGVLFMIGVSDGKVYTELLSLVMDPSSNPGDRHWQDMLLDLSAYTGQSVEVIFNTRASPPQPPVDDRAGDMPAWGSPQIVIR
jgi:hypothetical protein